MNPRFAKGCLGKFEDVANTWIPTLYEYLTFRWMFQNVRGISYSSSYFFIEMASVWKRPKSCYWTACFTEMAGRRTKKPTKETTQVKALKIAEAYEVAATKRRTFTQVGEVLKKLHQEITGEELKAVSVCNHIENWLAEKKDETKPATMVLLRVQRHDVSKVNGRRESLNLGASRQYSSITVFLSHFAVAFASSQADASIESRSA